MSTVQKLWHVVKFSDSQLGIVAEPWLCEDRKTCRYPKSANRYDRNAITEACTLPKSTWPIYEITKFYKRNITALNIAKDELMDLQSEVSDSALSPPSPVAGASKNVQPIILPLFPGEGHDEQQVLPVQPEQPPQQPTNQLPLQVGQPPQQLPNQLPNQVGQPLQQLANQLPNQAGQPPQLLANQLPNQVGQQLLNELPNQVGQPPQLLPNQVGQPPEQLPNHVGQQEIDAALEAMAPAAGVIEVPAVALRGLLRASIATNRYLSNLQNGNSSTGSSESENRRASMYSEMENALLAVCPFEDIQAFELMDKKLKKSKTMRAKLRAELELLKATDARSTCQAMIMKIMSDQVAEKYSFKGRPNSRIVAGGKKKGFNQTTFHNLIYQVTNALFSKSPLTADSYKDALRGWFSQAKFRRTRRENRAALRQQNIPVDNEGSSSQSEPDSD